MKPKTLPQSLVGKVVTCALNQKEYLGSFLKDGRIQLLNDLCEQKVKPFVIGDVIGCFPIHQMELHPQLLYTVLFR